jgi:hypothetical protein
VVVNWDVTRYRDRLPMQPKMSKSKTSLKREASLKKEFPPLNGVKASTPCIIIDKQGVIVTWYLPGILADSRKAGLFTLSNHGSKPDTYQGAIIAATEKLKPSLEKGGTSWRADPETFYPGTSSGTEAPEGCVSISPAWFQQGHEVSVSAYKIFIDR